MTPLHTRWIGSGGPVLLLLHGLGANGEVWGPLVETIGSHWRGRIVIPDLRGHGRSALGAHYGYGQLAADVAGLLEPGEEVHVIGHSLGGVVGMVLGSGWYGVNVRNVFGVGIKVNWSEDDLSKAAAAARMPVRWFDSRAEAAERMLKVAGLFGLVASESAVVEAGLQEHDGKYRLALDPRAFSAPGPSFATIAQACKARYSLVCGANDKMVSCAELRAYDRAAVEVPGRGHNLQVEAPAVLWDLARPMMS